MPLEITALQGVLKRARGGSATRMQALVVSIGAAAAVYKLLRSGEDEEDEATELNGAASSDDGSPAASENA